MEKRKCIPNPSKSSQEKLAKKNSQGNSHERFSNSENLSPTLSFDMSLEIPKESHDKDPCYIMSGIAEIIVVTVYNHYINSVSATNSVRHMCQVQQ